MRCRDFIPAFPVPRVVRETSNLEWPRDRRRRRSPAGAGRARPCGGSGARRPGRCRRAAHQGPRGAPRAAHLRARGHRRRRHRAAVGGRRADGRPRRARLAGRDHLRRRVGLRPRGQPLPRELGPARRAPALPGDGPRPGPRVRPPVERSRLGAAGPRAVRRARAAGSVAGAAAARRPHPAHRGRPPRPRPELDRPHRAGPRADPGAGRRHRRHGRPRGRDRPPRRVPGRPGGRGLGGLRARRRPPRRVERSVPCRSGPARQGVDRVALPAGQPLLPGPEAGARPDAHRGRGGVRAAPRRGLRAVARRVARR